MKKKIIAYKRLMLLFLPIISLILCSSFILAQDISSCVEINSSGFHTVVSNLSSSNDCLLISSSDVVLDGGENTVGGQGLNKAIVVQGVNNVTVQNLFLKNFTTALFVKDSSKISVKDSSFNATSNLISLDNVSSAIFKSNTFEKEKKIYSINAHDVSFNSTLQYLNIDATQSNITFKKIIFGDVDTQVEYNSLQSDYQIINSSKDLSVLKNQVMVDSLSSPALNMFAKITLNLIDYLSLSRYSVFKDGVLCSDCIKKGFNPVLFDTLSFSTLTTKNNSAPSVFNLYPLNGTSYDQGEVIEISMNITDVDNDTFPLTEATIQFPNGTVVSLSLSNNALSKFNGSFEIPSLGGLYSIQFVVNDSNLNENTSESTKFIVNGGVDLIVSSVQNNPTNPTEGQLVIFESLIINNGSATADSVNLSLYEGGILVNSTLINLSQFSSDHVNLSTTAKIGSYNYSVIVDSSNVVSEIYETNNQLDLSLIVSSYNLYHGFVTADLKIGEIDKSLVTFFNETVLHVFTVGSSSSVDFSSLQALGKNIYANSALNDFSELDQSLGMVSLPDSILNVYAINNDTAKDTASFTIFEETILNVPIMNNSLTSQFSTGILWDTSDDNNSEYDSVEREDLVFVSQINRSGIGEYGVYDYEVRVPALLRDYSGADDSVYFYLELG